MFKGGAVARPTGSAEREERASVRPDARAGVPSAAGDGTAEPTGSPPMPSTPKGAGPRKWPLGWSCQWWSRLQEARGLLAAIWPGAGPAHGPRRAGPRAREGLVARQALERAQRASKTVRACVLRRGETEKTSCATWFCSGTQAVEARKLMEMTADAWRTEKQI